MLTSLASVRNLLPAAATVLTLGGCMADLGPEQESWEPERSASGTKVLSVPFVTQQPNEGACSAASMAMALRYHGVTTLSTGHATWAQAIYNWFSARGYVTAAGFIDNDHVREATQSLSSGAVEARTVWWSGSDLRQLRASIDAGHPSMLFTYHNLLPGSGITAKYGHSIMVYGYTGSSSSGYTYYYYNPYKWSASAGAFTISQSALKAAVITDVHVAFVAKGSSSSSGSCHSGSLFGWSYCSASCPCGEGQGDCDRDDECQSGLVCAQDVGASYGAGSTVDVCRKPSSSGSSSGSSSSLKANWASCSSDAECSSHLCGCNGGTAKRCLPSSAYDRSCSASNWSCSKSAAYGGTQLWTCQSGNIYRCYGSSAAVQTCTRGCWSNSTGKRDYCVERASSWSCSKSAYYGSQLWTCSSGRLYRCDALGPVMVRCAAGCSSKAYGQNDRCN